MGSTRLDAYALERIRVEVGPAGLAPQPRLHQLGRRA